MNVYGADYLLLVVTKGGGCDYVSVELRLITCPLSSPQMMHE
jgi:hypothetical protein